MLLSFSIKNFRSFKDESKILFDENNSIAAIYGNTASGKSNFIKAIQYVQDFVLLDAPDIDFEKIQTFYCNENDCSTFEFEFSLNGENNKYRYGLETAYSFKYGFTFIKSEWLFENNECLFFKRDYDKIEFGDKFEFLKKEFQIFSLLEEANHCTLLKIIARYYTKQIDIYQVITNVINYFKSIKIINNQKIDLNDIFEELYENQITRNCALSCLSFLDDSIENFVLRDGKIYIIRKFYNEENKKEEFEFELSEEPFSIQRVISFANKIVNNNILIIDDLDLSLHTLSFMSLSKYVIGYQLGGKGQLIFSANDEILIGKGYLKPEIIWIVKKHKNESFFCHNNH